MVRTEFDAHPADRTIKSDRSAGLEARLGKIRGVHRLASEGIVCVLAVDHGRSFADRLAFLLGREPSRDEVAREKRRILCHLAPEASGVVCDPEIGVPMAIDNCIVPRDCAIIAGLADVPLNWKLAQEWPWPANILEAVKRSGCDAVKICILASTEEAGPDKVMLAAEVAEQCQMLGLALILEVVTSEESTQRRGYRPRARPRINATLGYVKEFAQVGADLLKLHLPRVIAGVDGGGSALARSCSDISAAAAVPWVLLSAGTNFDLFEHDLELACRAGASGFVAGTAIWQETLEIDDPYRRDEFLADVGIARMRRLSHIAKTHGRHIFPFVERRSDSHP